MRQLTYAEAVALCRAGSRYRRVGTFRAERLTRASTRLTSSGDALEGRPGDWVVSDGSREWVVAAEVFPLRYRLQEDGTYRSSSVIWSVPLHERLALATLEGVVQGRSGDHLALGDQADVWIVDQQHFATAYEIC